MDEKERARGTTEFAAEGVKLFFGVHIANEHGDERKVEHPLGVDDDGGGDGGDDDDG